MKRSFNVLMLCRGQLVRHNADVNLARNEGVTPVCEAAAKGHTECIAALVAANADVNQPTKDGGSPVYIAA